MLWSYRINYVASQQQVVIFQYEILADELLGQICSCNAKWFSFFFFGTNHFGFLFFVFFESDSEPKQKNKFVSFWLLMQCQSSIHSQISLFFGNGFGLFGQKSKPLRYFFHKKTKQVMLCGKIDL